LLQTRVQFLRLVESFGATCALRIEPLPRLCCSVTRSACCGEKFLVRPNKPQMPAPHPSERERKQLIWIVRRGHVSSSAQTRIRLPEKFDPKR
jgi:hypothetical protein